MQFPITIGLHRSALMGWGLVASHLLAAGAVAIPAWPLAARLGLLMALAASGAWGWRRLDPAVAALRLLGDGRLECRCPDETEFQAVEVLRGATVHPWLTALRVKTATGTRSLVIAPDSLPADDFRRLRVWLRWRAEISPGKADA